MQVCVVYYSQSNDSSKIKNISQGIADGISSQGNANVSVFDAKIDTNVKLTIYDYIVIVSEPVSFFSARIPDSFSKFFENAGQVSGKRAACIISGNGLREGKALLNLMKMAESQGIILKTSDIIKKIDDAKSFGSHLNIERNF